jgi:hypothetical protein
VCLLRYWRETEDGSFVICIQSTVHSECPESDLYSRALCHGGGFTIAPPTKMPTSASIFGQDHQQPQPQPYLHSLDLASTSRLPSSPVPLASGRQNIPPMKIPPTAFVTLVVHMKPRGVLGLCLRRLGLVFDYVKPQICALLGLEEVLEARQYAALSLTDTLSLLSPHGSQPNIKEDQDHSWRGHYRDQPDMNIHDDNHAHVLDGGNKKTLMTLTPPLLPCTLPQTMWRETPQGTFLVRLLSWT